jgi:hypothetical protein
MTKEESNQFMKSLETLKQISSPDEGFRKISDMIIKYRFDFCELLKKRIRDIIDYLCKYVDREDMDFCSDEIKKIISALCKYYELYRKYCCAPCCSPKIPEWELVVMNLDVINLNLSPNTITQDDSLEIPEIDWGPEIPIFPSKICEELKNTIKQLAYIICKYREQNLCADNELTRSITKLCKIYPYFRGQCCDKK